MVGHILRGGRKASICCKFYAGGLKGDTDSGLAMYHTPLPHVNFATHYHNQNEIRGMLRPQRSCLVWRNISSLSLTSRRMSCARGGSVAPSCPIFPPCHVVGSSGMNCMRTMMCGSQSCLCWVNASWVVGLLTQLSVGCTSFVLVTSSLLTPHSCIPQLKWVML